LTAALAAALLEKLVQPSGAAQARRLQQVRTECLALVQQDADTFSRVIQTTRRSDRAAFRRALQSATDIPCRIFERARLVQDACLAVQRTVKPQFQSDLRCAAAVATGAAESARTLVLTNLAWLNDPAYTRRIKRRLQAAARHARPASR
jgi:formiminotetrahydrofolate cyclodeaminase